MDVSHSLDPESQPGVRPGADWERAAAPSPSSENGRPADAHYSQAEQQQQVFISRGFQADQRQNPPESGTEATLSPSQSPAHSLDAELEVPLETDIDDFQELPVEELPISSELPCFAQPVTVLETDIDTLPDPGDSPSAEALDGSGSLEEEEELELFPPSVEGESETESWRGGCPSAEHNTDSLDR